MYTRIALVKTGWSDDYQGGVVVGKHGYIKENDEAGERFNFRQSKDGRFYAYIPPIGGGTPKPGVRDGWLILFVAARKVNGPLTVVGWYHDATIHEDYMPRPEYETEDDFSRLKRNQPYTYCISADQAHLILMEDRQDTMSGEKFRRTPILYLRGNGNNEEWRAEMALWAESVVKAGGEIDPSPTPALVFPDPETRKRIEIAAVDTVIAELEKDYHIADRQKDNCGYDLLARHKETGKELHIEVKGTSREYPHFYMTHNEHKYMDENRWRLAMVTNALNVPEVMILKKSEVSRMFDLEPFAWRGVVK